MHVKLIPNIHGSQRYLEPSSHSTTKHILTIEKLSKSYIRSLDRFKINVKRNNLFYSLWFLLLDGYSLLRLARRVLMMTQQRTCTICNPKLITIFAHLEKYKGPIRLQGFEILSFHWMMEQFRLRL